MNESVDWPGSRVPIWFWGATAFGVAWNLYGLYQFAGTFTRAGQAAMTAGMTSAQAGLYVSLPAWTSVVFAVGVCGGLVGSSALLLRRRSAQRVLTASFVGYVLLFSGDVYYGVFSAIPSQLAILAVVVLIAAGLLALSWRAGRHHWLR